MRALAAVCADQRAIIAGFAASGAGPKNSDRPPMSLWAETAST
jgi:hypothetical protein